MSAYQFTPFDIVNLIWAPMGWTSGDTQTVEIISVRPTTEKDSNGVITLGCELEFVVTNESIYEWSVDEEMSSAGFTQAMFHANPYVQSTTFPWSPGFTTPQSNDAIGGPASFGIQPTYGYDAQNNPLISVDIFGAPPLNALDMGIASPTVIGGQCVASITGGSLPAGNYLVAISARDASGSNYNNCDYSQIAQVYIPSGTTGSIVVTPIWAPGNVGADLFIASGLNIANAVWHFNQTLSANQYSATITTFNQSTPGGPDTVAHHLEALYRSICHSGLWTAQVVGVSGNTITFYGPGMTNNQYAGYTLSLLAQFDPAGPQPIMNLPVVSSTASTGSPATFTVTINASANALTSSLYPQTTPATYVGGDLMVMRYKATFTANGFSDANIANGFYTSGDTVSRAGYYAVVLSGADILDVKPIASNSTTAYTLVGNWAVTPQTGDIVVICYPNQNFTQEGTPFSCSNTYTQGQYTGANANMISNVLPNSAIGQVYLIQVRTDDINGNHCPDQCSPFRELYVWGIGSTFTLMSSSSATVSIVENPTVGRYLVDISQGNVVIQLLPGSNRPLIISIFNVGTTVYTCTIFTATGDFFPDGTSSAVLTTVGDYYSRA
jgi:hypothetical protein